MRVKSGVVLSGAELDGTAPHSSTMLETDPTFLAYCASSAPYTLISPFSFTPPAALPPSVVIAAVRVRPLPITKPTSKTTNAAAKRKQPLKSDTPAAGISEKSPAQRNVKPKLSKPSTKVLPFKHVSTVGLAPLTTIMPSEPSDITELYRSKIAPEKKPKGKRTEDQSDARVALKVIPGGQLPSRPKSGAKDPNGRPESAAGSKSKPPRAPKRPSASTDQGPEAAGGQHLNLRGSEWHPGMHTVYGITFIDPIAGSDASPPPPVVEGVPPRYKPMPLTSADLPKFNEDDPLLASIEYLKYLATTVGRIQSFPTRLQQGFNLEQRLYRERLARAMLARDGRSTEKNKPGGTRRSTRTRFAPDTFIPLAAGGLDGRSTVYGRSGKPDRTEDEGEEDSDMDGAERRPFDPADLTDVRLGSSYQANIPPLQRRPTVPTPEESRWEESLVLKAGQAPPPSRISGGKNRKPAYEDRAHAAAITKQVANLASAVGPTAAANFGLGSMGVAMVNELTTYQQDQLYEGMKVYGRDFHAISKEFVIGVPPHIMAQYYFDVWKLRACPGALHWYADKAKEEEAREAEAAKLEKQRAEDAVRRAERQEASNRRRQVKESFYWIKASARGPTEINFNKPIVRERAARIGSVLRMIAENKVASLEVKKT